jgi:hypothetical protein
MDWNLDFLNRLPQSAVADQLRRDRLTPRQQRRNEELYYSRTLRRRTRDLTYYLKLPDAIRQMIVDIWRAGVRARSVERQRPAPITLGLTHAPWLRDNRVNGMWQWFATFGAGNNAVGQGTLGHSYAYGGNPAHYVLTVTTPNRRGRHEADDWGTNLRDTFGNTLTKLIEYVLPRHHYDNWGTAEVNAEHLRLRGIRRVRWVDRMI